MGSIPRVSVVTGARAPVPSAPLPKHLEHLADSDATALVYNDETYSVSISYAELEARTNALARAIATRARPTGSNRDGDFVIAVCMQPTHNTIITLLASWKAGAAYVPMEPSFPQGRITHILNDAQPSLVVYDESANPAMFANSGIPAVSIEELTLEASAFPADRPRPMEMLAPSEVNSIAILLYTSGSTGIPKGVRLTYSAICNRLWWQFRIFPYTDTERICVWKTALTFVDSISEIWGPLLHGRTLLILSKETTRDPQKLVRVLAENQVQRLVLVPTLLRSILMYLSLNPSERPLQYLKLWVCSGETLSKDLAEQFFSYFGDQGGYKLANFYGSTEVMGDVTYYVLEKAAQLDILPTISIDIMGSIPRVSVVTGARAPVPSAPLPKHLEHLADSDATALVYNDETCSVSISYAELEARTNALARAIATRARPTGSNRDGDFVIAVCMQPTHNTIITLLASWKAGAAYVPMEPSFPQGRITHILNDAQPALVVYDESANPAMFANSGIPAVSFEELTLEASAFPADRPRPMEMLAPSEVNSIAIVLYTSGSTGIPKGVRLTYSAICNRLWWQFRTFPYTDTERTCVWKTALTFGDSIAEIWGPLFHGRTLLILSKETTRDPQKFVRVLAENQVQRLVLVPTLLRSILMYLSLNPSERPLQYLKLWVCSGETLSKDLAEQFFSYFGDQGGYKLANFYGSTEVLGDVTYYVLEKAAQLGIFPTIPIGSPLDNCAIYLLDEEMNPSRESEPGEVWVAGANLAVGYVGGQDPEKFCDNPYASHPDFGRLYRTGDYGILQKGMILYAGRSDSQVKIRGHKVDLQEVERAVNAVQGVDKSVVLCYGLDTGNPEILAFVTVKPEARTSGYQIETALKSALTNYMIPQVIVIDTIPLLFNGKVDRQALLKMYENTNNNDDTAISLDIDYSGVDAEDMEAAKVLFETVGEVLGRAARGTLSMRAGFYELGGNSLNSIYAITRLRDRGYYIKISDFLGATNLGEVLTHLSTNPNGRDKNSELKFIAQPMRDEHKEEVLEMIASFYKKAKCFRYCSTRDHAKYIEACWDALLLARLSVVLEDASGTPVAVALNFDARDELEIELSGGLAKIIACLESVVGSVQDTMLPEGKGGLTKIKTFLKFVEGPFRDTKLPEGKGMILHSFMMATSASLSARDNVAAIYELEHATMRVARERRFAGVFTINTSPLTQQLGTDVFGFQTLLDYQINQVIDSNGDRIFRMVPDDARAIVCWKPVE